MRINLKCDKNYNGNINESIVSSSYINIEVLEGMVTKYYYVKNNKVNIDVTKELVDFYNTNARDMKSAQSLARYLRRQWINIYGDSLLDKLN